MKEMCALFAATRSATHNSETRICIPGDKLQNNYEVIIPTVFRIVGESFQILCGPTADPGYTSPDSPTTRQPDSFPRIKSQVTSPIHNFQVPFSVTLAYNRAYHICCSFLFSFFLLLLRGEWTDPAASFSIPNGTVA